MKFDVSFLFGGQIKGDKLRLYMIYSAGNFIECTVDTPYLQIGEHKYGKPILDRAGKFGIDIYDALKISLLSMDSTMRSNLGVGMPIDCVVVRRDALDAELVVPDRAGRAVFPRSERALVGGAARRAHGQFRGRPTSRRGNDSLTVYLQLTPCRERHALRGRRASAAAFTVTGKPISSIAP